MQLKSNYRNHIRTSLCKNALNNASLKDSDGIVASTLEKCIQNMAYLSKVGMKEVDRTIVEIMENQF